MCVIQDDTPIEEEGFVVDIEGNTDNIHEPEEPHIIHYLDDSVEVNNTGIILDFNEEESSHILEEYWDTLRSNIPCEQCEECIPCLVQVYRTDWATGQTSFSRFAQVCQNLDRIATTIHANNGTHPSAPHSSTKYDTDESDIKLPELIDISEEECDATMDDIPQANGIIHNLGPDLEDDEGEIMGQFHSLQIPSCPYCNNCTLHVVVNFFVNYYRELFTCNRLICQTTGAGATPSL
jgi:hypothetical protein